MGMRPSVLKLWSVSMPARPLPSTLSRPRGRRQIAEAAGSSSKPCPGYDGAINCKCLKHKIMEMTKNEKSGGSSSSASMFTPAELTAKAMSMGPPHKRLLNPENRGSPSDHLPNPVSPRKNTELMRPQMRLQNSHVNKEYQFL